VETRAEVEPLQVAIRSSLRKLSPTVQAEPEIEAAPQAEAELAVAAPSQKAAVAAEPVVEAPRACKAAHARAWPRIHDDFSAALEALSASRPPRPPLLRHTETRLFPHGHSSRRKAYWSFDVGLKSELACAARTVQITPALEVPAGDVIEVVIEREGPEGGYSGELRTGAAVARLGTRLRRPPADKDAVDGHSG